MTDQLKSIDWRELCEELVLRWDVDGCDWKPQHQARWNAAVGRVRTTLDLVKPEPEAVGQTPSDEELDHLERQYWEETGVEERGLQEAIFNHRAFARAVLARYGNQPAPVAESEVKDRVTWLQKFAAVDWIADETADKLCATAKLLEQCYCPASVPVGEVRYAKDVRRMCEIILGNTFGNEELDSLALLVGHHPDVLNASTVPVSSPLPVAAGEVAELVEFLRVWATLCPPTDKPSKFTRAADLLEQRHPTPMPVDELLAAYRSGAADVAHPTPVPVSERLPVPVAPYREVADLVVWLEDHSAECLELDRPEWSKFIAKAAKFLHLYLKAAPVPVAVNERLPQPEDCDEKGRCWWLHVGEDGVGDWFQRAPYPSATSYAFFRMTHWLPAHALPLPSGEGEK